MARAESGIFGPIQGWLTDRFGPRALIRVGTVIFGVGYLLFSQIQTPLTFFLTFFMLAVGSSLAGYLPIGVAIVNWFRRRRSLALSMASTGMPIGGLLTPLIVLAMTKFGWRWTAAISGLVILAVGLPLSRLVHHRPEPLGLRPDGDPPDAAPAGAAARGPAPARDFTAREAIRTPTFWYISIGHGSALLIVSAIIVHLIPHLTERLGYSLQQAATVVALMTVVQVGGQLSGGWMGDRLNKRLICVGCMAAHASALLLLAWAWAYWVVVVGAMLHGLAWGVRGPLMAAIRADYFGPGAFGMITGISSMVVMFGMMGGPLVAGILADQTGSYRLGFEILAGLAASGGVFFFLARRPRLPTAARIVGA